MIQIAEHGYTNKGFAIVEDTSKEYFKLTIYDQTEEEAINQAKKFINNLKKKRNASK